MDQNQLDAIMSLLWTHGNDSLSKKSVKTAVVALKNLGASREQALAVLSCMDIASGRGELHADYQAIFDKAFPAAVAAS